VKNGKDTQRNTMINERKTSKKLNAIQRAKKVAVPIKKKRDKVSSKDTKKATTINNITTNKGTTKIVVVSMNDMINSTGQNLERR